MTNSWDEYINEDGTFDAFFDLTVTTVKEWPDDRLVRVHYASTIQRVIPESAVAAIDYEMNRRNISYETIEGILTGVSMFKDGVYVKRVSFADETELKTFT
jgi:hypothetical protein